VTRVEQETVHAFFRLNVVPHSLKEFGVVTACFAKIGLAVWGRLLKGLLDQTHYQFIIVLPG